MITYTTKAPSEIACRKIFEWRKAHERLRKRADFNTGSISPASMAYLWQLIDRIKPTIAVEIGTFIGNSTQILAFFCQHVYTCDKDNDCVDRTRVIHPHPKTTSTAMLYELVRKGVKADVFFFDGRIQGPDLSLILRLSHPMTSYLFDDFNGKEKGVVNVALLYPYLRTHAFVHPPKDVNNLGGGTTIAALLPKEFV